MNTQLERFKRVPIQAENLPAYFDEIRLDCEKMLINLFENGCISKDLLFHTTGLKPTNSNYQRITEDLAKYFDCKSPAYAYPLFKTRKLTEELLRRTHVTEIPVRLLQSAGQITTSRVTAMIEYILEPVAQKYCQEHINEYCRGSKHYLEELDPWKTKNEKSILEKRQKSKLFIVAADI